MFVRSPAPFAALLCLSLAALTLSGCGEKDKAEKKKTVDFLAKPEGIDFSQVPVQEVKAEAPAKPAVDTWSTRTKEQVKLAHDDLMKCRNDYMIPFQFNKMRRRDVEWVSLSDMDEFCMDGSPEKKTRGPWKIVRALAEEHLGRNPALDRFIVLATDQMEHYRVLSFMAKKIGAPDIDIVTETAQQSRDRVLFAGADLDRAAADIEKWPDELQPDDDPAVVGADVDVATFRQQLVDSYGFFLADLGGAYDRYANKSWLGYNMPKMESLRRWVAVPTKRIAKDRARLEKVKGLDGKQAAEFRAFFDATDKAMRQIEAGYDRYTKQSKDERGEKDPNRKAVETTQKAALKHLTGWGLKVEVAK